MTSTRLLIYNPKIYTQLIFEDFDQSVNLKINPENRWIKKGNVAQPLQIRSGTAFLSHFKRTSSIRRP